MVLSAEIDLWEYEMRQWLPPIFSDVCEAVNVVRAHMMRVPTGSPWESRLDNPFSDLILVVSILSTVSCSVYAGCFLLFSSHV